MPTQQELVQAKNSLSSSLLRAGLHGGVLSRTRSIRVSAAVANSGQNVHAVGVGRKISDGVVTNEKCVRIYVVQKLPPALIPPAFMIPAEIDGIPTDVIESPPAFILGGKGRTTRATATGATAGTATATTGTATATAGLAAANEAAPVVAAVPACSVNRQVLQRPLVPGVSVGHFAITAGTLGCFCRSTRHGENRDEVYLLSNNHVFADVNRAQPGDDIYQPGPMDGGTGADTVADLSRWSHINLDGVSDNYVDGAIARLRPGIVHQTAICAIGQLAGTVLAPEGTLVRKHGRTTGYTVGEVSDDSYDALVGMDHEDDTIVALFKNQLRIASPDAAHPFGLGGDSGSLVVARDQLLAVGLYFAGPPSGSYGIANPIQNVLNELEIELL